MNRILGYSLMGMGLTGFFFLLNYQGAAIAFKGLWFVLCVLLIIAGGYLLAKYKLHTLRNRSGDTNSERLAAIEQLKRTGEKVIVTLDNAEVKSRSYQQEMTSEGLPSRAQILDAFYDGNRNYEARDVQQSYVVFYRQYNNQTYKFVSQPTTTSPEALRLYIDQQNGINLYIDRNDPGNYYFELPSL